MESPGFRLVTQALSLGALAFTLASCDSGTSEADATVSFELDAPLCSSIIPVQFEIDGIQVGVDTFRIHLPPDHVRSKAFSLDPGEHLLGAAVPDGFVWPDTMVHLAAGDSLIRQLPFYCS
jgi:hypothetical protein